MSSSSKNIKVKKERREEEEEEETPILSKKTSSSLTQKKKRKIIEEEEEDSFSEEQKEEKHIQKKSKTKTEKKSTKTKTKRKTKTKPGEEKAFIATFPDAKIFKTMTEASKQFCHEIQLIFSENGITSQFMDSSHVSLSLIKLVKEECVFFQHHRNIAVGIQLDSFLKIFQCLKSAPESSFTFRVLSEDSKSKSKDLDCLFVDIKNLKEQDRTFNYALKMLDIDQESLDIPNTVYEWVIDMSTTDYELVSAIDDDIVAIGISEKALYFSSVSQEKTTMKFKIKSKGSEIPKAEIQEQEEEEEEEENKNKKNKKKNKSSSVYIKHNRENLEHGEPSEHFTAIFATSYLTKYQLGTKISSTGRVKLYLSPDIPIRIEIPILSTGQSSLTYFLAPKIEDDDNPTSNIINFQEEEEEDEEEEKEQEEEFLEEF